MRYVTSFERIVRQEGLEEGRQEGRAEGRQEGLSDGLRTGQAALVHRLLELRFGALVAEQVALLSGADLQQLSRWAERVLTAGSLSEVFAAE